MVRVYVQDGYPTGLLNLRALQIHYKLTKKNVTIMWYANDMFRCMFKAEFVTLESLKVPSDRRMGKKRIRIT